MHTPEFMQDPRLPEIDTTEHAKSVTHLGQMVFGVFNIEQFPTDLSREVFGDWCAYNDHIKLAISSDQEPMIASDGESITLHLPESLTFEKAIATAHMLADDTYADRPEQREVFRAALAGDAEQFANASRYFAMQADEKESDTAENLRDYALRYDEIARALDPERANKNCNEPLDIEATERWILGDEVYEKRANEHGKIPDAVRNKTLARLFSRSDVENPGFAEQLFAQKTVNAIYGGIRATNPLMAAVYDRGVDMVSHQLGAPSYVEGQEQTLYEYLQLDKWKVELAALRAADSNVTRGEIAEFECRLVENVRQALTQGYPYKDPGDSPSAIIALRQLNCLGAATIAVRLLTEVGINCFAVRLRYHSMFAYRTASDDFYLSDATPGYHHAKDSNIRDMIDSDSPGKLHDTQKTPQSIHFGSPPHKSFRNYRRTQIGDARLMQYSDALANLAAAHNGVGNLGAAKILFEAALAVDPESANTLANFGRTYRRVGNLGAAKILFEAALAVDPETDDIPMGLGTMYDEGGNFKEAQNFYEMALAIKPDNAFARHRLTRINALLSRNVY